MRKLSLVIFDMDGLMFDTEKISIESWRRSGKRYGCFLSEEFLMEIVGMNDFAIKTTFKKHYGDNEPFEEIDRLHYEIKEEIIAEKGIAAKPGLLELLDYLAMRKIPCAVATATNHDKAIRNLKIVGVRDYFECVICGNEVKRSKPEPDIFLAAAEKIGCPPDECIVLEDSENGIRAAHRAGMIPIMIPDVKQPCEEVAALAWKQFTSLHEVREILQNGLV